MIGQGFGRDDVLGPGDPVELAAWWTMRDVGETGTSGPERRRVRALGDAALIAAMRDGDDWAWAEFDARFRARLEQYARHAGIPPSRWDECVAEVIEDAALKLTSGAETVVPANLTAYLIRSVRNRALTLARAAARRHRRHVQASAVGEREPAVWSLCSEAALRASGAPASSGPDDHAADAAARARRRLGAALAAELNDEEQCIVAWVAEAVPYRQIAAWLGASYDATSKRIWRLCRRLKQAALVHANGFDDAERAELERFFRRVGAVHTPVSAVAAGRRGGNDR